MVILNSLLTHRLAPALRAARPEVTGRVDSVLGLSVAVVGVPGRVGDLLRIGGPAGILRPGEAAAGSGPTGRGAAVGSIAAEVVALNGDRLFCLPLGPLGGVGTGDRAVNTGAALQIQVGEVLRGRVLDGLGRPIDGGAPLQNCEWVSVEGEPPSAMERGLIREPLPLGVRALDTLIPCGRGQRMGIFAGSGVGKSSLLSMITRGTEAEITVVALIGERGREVREFLEHDLGPEGLARAVVVVSTSDQPPLVRLRAGFVATRIAEWYRDRGKDVLLLMDSLTRTAMAQREVGLSAGEPPATRGYPPSVFALLPRLLERAGPGSNGTITGLYTVLVEGDDQNEPIADAARSILDGHIVLDRKLATSGHFPSIDVLESVSRLVGAITTGEQRSLSTELRRLMAAYRDVRELVEIGAYVSGTNPDADRARELWPAINAFLRQRIEDPYPAGAAWDALAQLLTTGHPALR